MLFAVSEGNVGELGLKAKREAVSTLAAGVSEAAERRRDSGLCAANYLHPPAPLPRHELLGLHASHTASSFRPPARMLPLTLPDYSAADDQYSRAPSTGTPLKLLLSVQAVRGAQVYNVMQECSFYTQRPCLNTLSFNSTRE